MIGRIVGALNVVIRIALINAGVVAVRIIIIRVVVVRITVWVPRESEIEDEPRAVDKTATVAMPEMVAIPIPIAMPVGRMLREDAVVPIRRKIISIANLASTSSNV